MYDFLFNFWIKFVSTPYGVLRSVNRLTAGNTLNNLSILKITSLLCKFSIKDSFNIKILLNLTQ